MINLTDPIFTDADKARKHLEAIRWPDGPYCPHCGEVENLRKLKGKSHRPGLYQCNSCREHFTVTVGRPTRPTPGRDFLKGEGNPSRPSNAGY